MPYAGKNVVLSRELYNKLRLDYSLWQKQPGHDGFPWVGLLGRDEAGVVRIHQPVPRGQTEGYSRGCGNMPHITAKQMAVASEKIAKAGFIPCGVFRLGAFHKNLDRGSRGSSAVTVGGLGGFILSIGSDGIGADYNVGNGGRTHKILTVAVLP